MLSWAPVIDQVSIAAASRDILAACLVIVLIVAIGHPTLAWLRLASRDPRLRLAHILYIWLC